MSASSCLSRAGAAPGPSRSACRGTSPPGTESAAPPPGPHPPPPREAAVGAEAAAEFHLHPEAFSTHIRLIDGFLGCFENMTDKKFYNSVSFPPPC